MCTPAAEVTLVKMDVNGVARVGGTRVRGLLRRPPDIDVIRVQDVKAIAGAADPIMLAWAAQEDYGVLHTTWLP